MKKILMIALCAFCIITISAQEIEGSWQGKLKLNGISLRLVFNISKTDAGYTATMDSPDQGAKGIPMTSASFTNNVLTVEYNAAKLKYSGNLAGKDSISGTFVQFGQSFPLGLKRNNTSISTEIRHPQEPVTPYPYKTEDVKFLNSKDNVTLAGTLTFPDKGKNFPAVVLITGSGPQNRNEELLGHKPFLVIADYLTRQGFAVLRYDDRGSFESTGDFAKATTFDLANDAEAAIDFLRNRKEINAKKIGLMGHSEGGLIAPIIAARNKNVAFIVMLAGPGISGGNILLLQQELIGRVNGLSEKDITTTRDINTELYSIIDKTVNNDTAKVLITDYLKNVPAKYPDMKIPEEMTPEQLTELQTKQLCTPWMLEFIRYNPASTLEKVTCPVLALIGSKDLQVPAKENIPALQNAFNTGNNKKATVLELEGLNHLFQTCKTGSPGEYATIEETFSPTALKVISDWLKKQ